MEELPRADGHGNLKREIAILLFAVGAAVWFFPALEQSQNATRVLDSAALKTGGLLASAVLWYVYFRRAAHLRRLVFPRIGNGVGRLLLDPCVFLVIYRMLMALPVYLNVTLDTSASELHQVAVIEHPKYAFGPSPSCTLIVGSWRPGREYEAFEADTATCSTARVGTPVFLQIRRGLFGFPWIESLSTDARGKKAPRPPTDGDLEPPKPSTREPLPVKRPDALTPPRRVPEPPFSEPSAAKPSEEEPDESIPVPSFGG